MADEIIGFNREGAEQYKKIAREVARRMQNETPHRARWQQQKGAGKGIIQFQPTDVCEGIGFTCDCVTAVVITASCESGMQPGDIVQVWDQTRGWFQMPSALLFNCFGWAQYVKITEAERYNLPFPLGDCRWVVTSMDCVEQ